ncbi:hypothetical protein JMUB6875_34150 [Nocardia sp. JMUB6875]
MGLADLGPEHEKYTDITQYAQPADPHEAPADQVSVADFGVALHQGQERNVVAAVVAAVGDGEGCDQQEQVGELDEGMLVGGGEGGRRTMAIARKRLSSGPPIDCTPLLPYGWRSREIDNRGSRGGMLEQGSDGIGCGACAYRHRLRWLWFRFSVGHRPYG